MTQDEIIRMAREADLYSYLWGGDINQQSLEAVEHFAALVAAHEREKLKTPHECQTEGEKTAFTFGWFKAIEQIEAAVLAEREACAKVCDEYAEESSNPMNFAENCATTIRARS